MMTEQNKIVAATNTFLQAADESNLTALSNSIHDKFVNLQKDFFDQKGVYSIDKNEYLELVRTHQFGGTPREVKILSVEIMEDFAIVKAHLQSKQLIFKSHIALAKVSDSWTVICNLPKVYPIEQ